MNYKKTALLASIFLVFSGTVSAFAGGDGSAGNPYQINTCSHIDEMDTVQSDDHFIFTSDVDCGDTDISGYASFDQNYQTLNGDGYKLSNFNVNSGPIFTPSSGTYEGFYGEIENLTMEDVDADGNIFSKKSYSSFQYNNLVLRDVRLTSSSDPLGIFANEFSSSGSNEITNIEIINTRVESTATGSTSAAALIVDYVGNDGQFEDITIKDSKLISSAGQTSGISSNGGSWRKLKVRNFTVENTGDVSNLAGMVLYGSVEESSFEDVTIKGGSTSEGEALGGIVAASGCSVDNIAVRGIEVLQGSDYNDISYIGSGDANGACSIDNSYVAGNSNISGVSDDFVASDPNNNTQYTDAYYDSQTIETPTFSYATALTTSEMTGTSAEQNMNFDFDTVWGTVDGEYPKLQDNIISPPTVSPQNPNDGDKFLQGEETVNFEGDVDTTTDESATVRIIVENPQGNNNTIYTTSQASGTVVTHTTSKNYSTTGDYSWYLNAETTEHNVTEAGGTFTVESYSQPSTNLKIPKNNSIIYWDARNNDYSVDYKFDIDMSSNVASTSWKLWVNKGNQDYNSLNVQASGSVSSSTDNITATDFERSVTGTYWWKVNGTDSYNDFDAKDYTYTVVKENVKATINNFDSTPDISDVQVGEKFDLEVDGDTGTGDIRWINYSMSVTGNSNPADINVPEQDVDFWDSSSFNDQQNDAYEMKDSYKGEKITFTVEVETKDEDVLTTSSTISDYTEEPPNKLVQVKPDDQEILLTSGDNQWMNVDIEYGVNTSKNGGTAELILGNTVEDSFSVNADSYNTETVTKNLTVGQYSWKVNFTDSNTGAEYSSSTRTFTVEDQPFGLSLDSPDGTTIDIGGSSDTDVNHDFKIDASPTNKDFYYIFRLENDSSGSTLVSRQSNTLDFSKQSFTETVNDLAPGDYRWNVSIYFSSDDSLQENKETTYTINQNPEYTASLDDPFDGEDINIPAGNQQTDVLANYSVDTKQESVDAELFLDGNSEHTKTFSSQTSASETVTLQNVDVGDHTVTLDLEDQSGRTQSYTHNFEVRQKNKANVTFDQISTTPSVSQASPGDDLDIYFEGTNNTKVEKVQVEILVDNNVEKTIVVPADELRTGSFYKELENAFTLTDSMVGSTISLRLTAFTAKTTYSAVRDYVFGGSNTNPFVTLKEPADGKDILRQTGETKNIRFKYDIKTGANPVDYIVYVNESGQPNQFSSVDSGTVSKTQDTVSVNTDLGFNDFQTYNWKVNITEQNTNYVNQSVTWSFQTINESKTDILLNFDQPRDNQFYRITGQYPTTTVPFDFEWDSNKAGTVTLKLDGETSAKIFDEDVPSGFDAQRITEELGVGSYTATLNFKADDGTTETKTRSFAVDRQIPNVTVSTREPKEGDTVYTDSAETFSWVISNADQPGDTWLEIYDSNNNLEENFTRQYNTQNEVQVYNELETVDWGSGTYEMTAYLTTGNGTQKSSKTVSFDVEDIQEPRVNTFTAPKNNSVWNETKQVNFTAEVEAFQQATTAEIIVRPVEDYNGRPVAEQDVSAYSTETVTGSSKFQPGQYAWYVRMSSNPVFTSDAYYFTVEESNPKSPSFTLNNPQQNETFKIPANQSEINVTFDYEINVFTESDVPVKLMISNEDDGLSNFQTFATYQQKGTDDIVSYKDNVSLDEDGYLWKLRAEYSNRKYDSDPVGFAVGENQTAPQPSQAESKKNFLTGAFATGASFIAVSFGGLGSTALFILASLFTVASGVLTSQWTNHSELGVLALVVSALTFTYIEWFEAWVGILIFLVGSGIFLWSIRKIHGGE